MKPLLILVLTLAFAGCGPSESELGARSATRERLTEVRARADALDAAFRVAVEAFDETEAQPCVPSALRSAPATTGQPPGNYAEYTRDRLATARLPITRQVREQLGRAAELLDDEEETFRWANGARLVEEAAEPLGNAGGYDLILVTTTSRPDAGADTYRSERLHGQLFGWDPSEQQIVCSGVFDADPPAALFVGQDSAVGDLGRAVNYRIRELAFEAAGFGNVEPSRYGAPSLW